MNGNQPKPHWEGKHYSFFQNTECEYFPCHRIEDPSQFSCLFCYCPLYALGRNCGGNYRYNEKGIKDCTDCLIPHLARNYGLITGKYSEIAELMRREEAENAAAQETGTEREETGDTRPRPEGRPALGPIVMMACTERGFETMRRAAAALAKEFPDAEILETGRCAFVPGFENGPRLSEITAEWFGKAQALVYCGATGIAVRCIAPHVRDKFRDPAVLAVDESGEYVISLLSGHAGGANRLCGILAEAIGAKPVITTATDGRGLFAADVYAAEKELQISDRAIAKRISARLLAGESVKVFIDPASEDFAGPSEELSKYGSGTVCTTNRGDADVIISHRSLPSDREDALYLIPAAVTMGIGCRKGTAPEAIESAAEQILASCGVFRQAVCGIASIDLKKEEEGLLSFGRKWGVPLSFFTERELNEVPGAFSVSDFVRKTTGVDCVCERSAVRLAGKDSALLMKKQSFNGVTAALAVRKQQQKG